MSLLIYAHSIPRFIVWEIYTQNIYSLKNVSIELNNFQKKLCSTYHRIIYC
jgi:hypothetical protein